MACLTFLSLAMALITPAPTQVDLRALDRKLVKEPAYQTSLPKYCLLTFGPAAKTRAWLVVDGNEAYVDRNGNGDLTEQGEHVRATGNGHWLEFDLGSVGTEPTRTVLVRLRDLNAATGKCAGMMILLNGKRKQFVGFDPADPFALAQRASSAPIVHLEGPLQLRLYGEAPTLTAGYEVELNVAIGTPGLGQGSFCAIQCCTVLEHKVSPVATLRMPPRRPGDPPLQLTIPIADD